MKARNVQELRSLWAEREPRRAAGGFWALSGFSIQMLVALEIFVRRIFVDGADISRPTVEQLSDILVAESAGTRLIQVKKRLNVAAFASSIREAYQIASHCSPQLLKSLTFQVACTECDCSMDPISIAAKSIFPKGEPYDAALLAEVVARFDRDEPVMLTANPLLALRRTMVLAGVQDPASTVTECLGLIFAAFDGQSQGGVENAIYDVIGTIRRRVTLDGKIASAGRMLSAADLAPLPPSDRERQRLVFGRRPHVVELVHGQFRSRGFFSQAARALREWLDSLPAKVAVDDGLMHAFWIKGRSGDGKSVLLLQLAADLVTSAKLPFVTELRTLTELREWMRSSSHPLADERDVPSMVGVIDDLHEKVAAVQLDLEIEQWVQCGLPANAIITCGPTTDLEAMQRSSARLCVTSFEVPVLTREEMREFRDWYDNRTGSSRSGEDPASSNQLLVGWLLTLATDEPAPEFARNLRNTLRRLDIAEASMAIAAVNALDLGAPVDLLRTARQQRNFEGLADSARGHFDLRTEQDEKGLYLSHPELAWPLFKSWAVADGDDVPTALGREVGKVIHHLLKAGQDSRARGVVGHIIDVKLIRRRFGQAGKSEIRAIQAAIADSAFETVSSEASRVEAAAIVPLWLVLHRQGVLTTPAAANLKDSAAALLSESSVGDSTRSEIACGLAAGRASGRPAELGKAHLIAQPATPEANSVVKAALRPTQASDPDFALKWLRSHRSDPGAAEAFAFAVTLPNRPEVMSEVEDFVDTNSHCGEISPVIFNWIRAAPEELPKPLVLRWMSNSPDEYAVARIFDEVLQTARGPLFIPAALDWLEEGHRPPNVHEMLKQLIKSDSTNVRLQKLLDEWIPEGLVNLSQAHTLAELLKSRSVRGLWMDRSIRAARLAGRQEGIVIMAELLRFANDPQVFQIALKWLGGRRIDDPAFFLLATLSERLGKLGAAEIEEIRRDATQAGRIALLKALAFKPRGRTGARPSRG